MDTPQISTKALSMLLASGGLITLFGPQLWSIATRLLRKPQPSVSDAGNAELISMLRSVVSLRSYVAQDPEAVRAIETVITPAVFRASKNET